MQHEKRNPLVRDGVTALVAVYIPEIAFVKQGQDGVDVQKVLLHEFIEYYLGRDPEAAL